MYIQMDVDNMYELRDYVFDDDALHIINKIISANKDDEAFEMMEEAFGGDLPDICDLINYINYELLNDMDITEEELDRIINGEDE